MNSNSDQEEKQTGDNYNEVLEFARLKTLLQQRACTIVVFGASGHLAKTKTFPAIFGLYSQDILPENVRIVGYARSKLNKKDYEGKVSMKLKGDKVAPFLGINSYFSGKGYDDDESFSKFNDYLNGLEEGSAGGANRLFYLATPPGVFVAISERIKKYLSGKDGWVRVIVEKPFGRDLDSSNALATALRRSLEEEQIYRIDHYLAKELVQNILTFRFSNVVWDAIWNRKYVSCVKISMKETATLEGRGGYYDEFGVIRDVFQNHLMQVLTLIAMEHPSSLSSEDVRDEKVKVMKSIEPMIPENTVVGQYGPSEDGSLVGYRDDESIRNGPNPNSNQITFMQTTLYINNYRWAGVPFVCKCGKALDARNTQVTIQFKNDGLTLFPDANFNEIVMRLQPNEAIWLKINNKLPGFARFDRAQTHELDLTYNSRFEDLKLPAAYTRLILDALKGDQSLFVRSDELQESWRIVTPFLKLLEENNADPPKYPAGSRGPEEADKMAMRHGFRLNTRYGWGNQRAKTPAPPSGKL